MENDMSDLNFSRTGFTPGQPIAMNKAYFTPDLQEAIISSHFNKAVPGAYETLAANIAQQEQQARAYTPPASIPQEAPARESVPQDVVNSQLDSIFGAPQQQTVQNQGIMNEPQQAAAPQPAQPNDNSDIMQRIFGDVIAPQTQQNEPQQNVNSTPTNDNSETMRNVRNEIARVCTARNLEPAEFIQYATNVSIEDIADLYVAYKSVMQEQQRPIQAQQQVQSLQQQGGGGPAQMQPNNEYASGTPINLAEVQPNPTNYQPGNDYQNKVNKFWQ